MGDLRARLALLTRSMSFGWILIPKIVICDVTDELAQVLPTVERGQPTPFNFKCPTKFVISKEMMMKHKKYVLLPEIVSSLDGAQPGFQRKVLSCQHTDVVLVLGAHGGVLRHLCICPAEDVKTVRWSH